MVPHTFISIQKTQPSSQPNPIYTVFQEGQSRGGYIVATYHLETEKQTNYITSFSMFVMPLQTLRKDQVMVRCTGIATTN